jgi:hypothetical protein
MDEREIDVLDEGERIAIVSVPFSGHLNVLLSLRDRFPNKKMYFFILSFEEFHLHFVATDNIDTTYLIANVPMGEHAKTFNELRSQNLKDLLHCQLHDYRPSLIVYDYFCIEAHSVSRLLGVPAICSIPAVLKPEETETCSDAILLPEHLYWIWRHPFPTALKNTLFLGPRLSSPNDMDDDLTKVLQGKRWIYVSFGTVVPRYAGCSEKLAHVMNAIKDYAKQEMETTHFVFGNIADPKWDLKNCTFLDYCDQVSILNSRPTCFIFHGGGNSFSEAIAAQVPCVVCPFFGDQFETAKQVGAEFIPGHHVMSNISYLISKAYVPPLPRDKDNGKIVQLIEPFKETFADYFRPGDMVFGQRKHRNNLQKMFPHIDLHLDHYCSFFDFAHPESGDLPAIADVYNDETATLSSLSLFETLLTAERRETAYGKRLRDVIEMKQIHPMSHIQDPEHRLVHWCVQILHLALEKWNAKIHFLLDDETEMGPATKIEFEHLMSMSSSLFSSLSLNVDDNILFYRFGKRCVDPRKVTPPKKRSGKDDERGTPIPITDEIAQKLVAPLLKNVNPPLFLGRKKSAFSISSKRNDRKLPVLDEIGFTIPYLCKKDLQTILENVSGYTTKLIWCNGKIVYFYFRDSVELQIWPYTHLAFFFSDQRHQTIKENSELIQERMQNAIEKYT